jgi:hypothetical protein
MIMIVPSKGIQLLSLIEYITYRRITSSSPECTLWNSLHARDSNRTNEFLPKSLVNVSDRITIQQQSNIWCHFQYCLFRQRITFILSDLFTSAPNRHCYISRSPKLRYFFLTCCASRTTYRNQVPFMALLHKHLSFEVSRYFD